MIIHQIDNGYAGASREIANGLPVPFGWTRKAPPTLGAGEYAKWSGGGWTVVTQPPVIPDQPQQYRTVMSKLEFLDKLTDTELEDFLDISALPAQAQRPMRAAIKKFDAASNVDVKDPRTIALLDKLVAVTVLTQARADELKLGIPL